jgi:5'-3' exonuclease
MHVHFDGDLLVYRCGFAAEKQQYHVGDETFTTLREAKELADQVGEEVVKGDRLVEPVEHALANVKSMVDVALENLGVNSDEMTMYLSGPTNFRTGIATIREYKGNRDPDHKPVHGPAIKEYMESKYPVKYSVDEEADDLVGYSHYAMWLRDEQSTVIATVDKDMDMIPGLHYNFVKDESYYVSPEDATRWFYLQLLMGDSTDNIPGIPGCGPKKASKMLEGLFTENEYFVAALDGYEQAYEDGLDALIENARLLWIRRQPNEWWEPPRAVAD